MPVALVALVGVTLTHAMPAMAQGARATGIAEQFEARAKERALRRQAAPTIPDIQGRQQGGDARPLLVLNAVEIEGASVLTRSEMGTAYHAYLGKSVSEADLRRLTSHISELYRQRGYALTRAFVPAQDVKHGRIRIQVLEGYIDEIVLEGTGRDDFGVRAMLAAITHERPLRLATLERHLLLASDTPGLRIQDTALEEKGEATGRFRLIVRLETWRMFASVDLDNRGSPDTGPLQSFVATALNSALVPGDSWAVNYATVPDSPEELAYLGGVVEFPLGPKGARIGLKASSSSIRPDDDASSVDARIRTHELGMYMSYAPLRTREASLKFTALAGLRNAHEDDSSGTVYDDHTRAVSLSAEYQQRDSYGGANYAVLTGRIGLPILGASDSGEAPIVYPRCFWRVLQSVLGPDAIPKSRWRVVRAAVHDRSIGFLCAAAIRRLLPLAGRCLVAPLP
ncbi:MAG: ShlB/FhaC/HecB family hemolysin secretion/activation protein, partial [Rhodospirillales bacterium]|nr:ShlB/FhaC/HecB family hemolysin secretion/activation protein [Rhodospirillales bacterium]